VGLREVSGTNVSAEARNAIVHRERAAANFEPRYWVNGKPKLYYRVFDQDDPDSNKTLIWRSKQKGWRPEWVNGRSDRI
jgi:hypothetical protein